ncbi:MAG: tRNA (guanosine(46)-N7)-methyltransferase TrmB [Bacteroidales bacterium]|nr:tRNA (guanosine(46)-N7)-methyltransferase TrmB [Bacteroidales bacterium]
MGKHKLARFAENLTFPNLFQVSYEYLEQQDFEWRGRWKEFFGNDNPIVLELGCGKGEYTIALARENSDRNYIGVDIKGARMWRGAKTSNEEQMKNVAFLRTRIEMINRFFGKDEVSEIWITFPDPQPKKPMKRLTSERFLGYYRQMLQPGSPIHLKTDSRELYDYTMDEVIAPAGYKVEFSTADLYNSGYNGMAVAVQTFYENMFLKEGKAITYIKFSI